MMKAFATLAFAMLCAGIGAQLSTLLATYQHATGEDLAWMGGSLAILMIAATIAGVDLNRRPPD